MKMAFSEKKEKLLFRFTDVFVSTVTLSSLLRKDKIVGIAKGLN